MECKTCKKTLPDDWEYDECAECDLEWHKQRALEEVERINARGQVPMYGIDDVEQIWPIGHLTIEEVEAGFNALFG